MADAPSETPLQVEVRAAVIAVEVGFLGLVYATVVSYVFANQMCGPSSPWGPCVSTFHAFRLAHPFDLLSLAAWFALGTWIFKFRSGRDYVPLMLLALTAVAVFPLSALAGYAWAAGAVAVLAAVVCCGVLVLFIAAADRIEPHVKRHEGRWLVALALLGAAELALAALKHDWGTIISIAVTTSAVVGLSYGMYLVERAGKSDGFPRAERATTDSQGQATTTP